MGCANVGRAIISQCIVFRFEMVSIYVYLCLC